MLYLISTSISEMDENLLSLMQRTTILGGGTIYTTFILLLFTQHLLYFPKLLEFGKC